MRKLLLLVLTLLAATVIYSAIPVQEVFAGNGDPYKPSVQELPKPPADDSRIQAALTIVFTLIGAISVVMFVAGGLRYISSQGDPQQISKAKGTLIYALVGLLVSISAVSIVTFVLGRL